MRSHLDVIWKTNLIVDDLATEQTSLEVSPILKHKYHYLANPIIHLLKLNIDASLFLNWQIEYFQSFPFFQKPDESFPLLRLTYQSFSPF